jgi:hypothetical protein
MGEIRESRRDQANTIFLAVTKRRHLKLSFEIARHVEDFRTGVDRHCSFLVCSNQSNQIRLLKATTSFLFQFHCWIKINKKQSTFNPARARAAVETAESVESGLPDESGLSDESGF